MHWTAASPWCIRNWQPIPARTVAENIWLGRYPTKKYGIVTVVDHAKMYKDTDELLKKLKLDIDPPCKAGLFEHRPDADGGNRQGRFRQL